MNAVLREWWLGLGRGERVGALAVAWVVALALMYLAAIAPAWKTHLRLQAELPVLRAQVVEISALSQEARQLAGRGVATVSAAAARAGVERSLVRAGLVGARVTLIDERRIGVSAQGIPAAHWLAWADEASRESRLRIVTMRMSRAASSAAIDVEALLELAGAR